LKIDQSVNCKTYLKTSYGFMETKQKRVNQNSVFLSGMAGYFQNIKQYIFDEKYA